MPNAAYLGVRHKKRMGQSASQAQAFYGEVAKNRQVWTIRDAGGFPAPVTASGKRAQPFWSSLSRVQKVISTVSAYSGFEPYELSWDEFRAKWVPGLERNGLLIGVNWSGKNAAGYDVDPRSAEAAVEVQIQVGENA